jgi:cellulose synthase/poly-beta-1,6-N-acetylglucosamine synthase-like glycosyltransferase
MGKTRRPSFLATLIHVWDWVNQHAGLLFLFGLVLALLQQARLWRQDQRCLAKIRTAPPLPDLETWPRLPQVSALVAAWNEAEHIQAHIESFLALRYPHKQFVLVAGGADGTFEVACKYTGDKVTVLEQFPGEGKQRALHRGLKHTYGEIVYLTDADCLLDDKSFETVLYPLVNGESLAVTGTSIPVAAQLVQPFIFSQAASHFYAACHQPEYSSGLLGCNCAVDKTTLLHSGGLQANALSGTDYVLAKQLARIGVIIRQVPTSLVFSDYPTTFTAYHHQQLRWLHNVVYWGRRYGAGDEVRAAWWNALIGLGMLLLPLVAVVSGPLWFAGWGVLLGYGWMARIRYAQFTLALTPMQLRRSYWLALPIFMLLDFIVWASAIPRYFQKRLDWS